MDHKVAEVKARSRSVCTTSATLNRRILNCSSFESLLRVICRYGVYLSITVPIHRRVL